MKTLFVFCVMVGFAAYGCQRAIDVGVITDVEEPGIKIIPPQPKNNNNSEQKKSTSPKQEEPQKVIPFHVDNGFSISI